MHYRDISCELFSPSLNDYNFDINPLINPEEILSGDSILCLDKQDNEIWIEVEGIEGEEILGQIYERGTSNYLIAGEHVRVHCYHILQTYHMLTGY